LKNETLRTLIFWFQEKRYLILALLVGTILYWMPYPQSISSEGYRTLIIAIMVIMLIVFEPIPLPAVALFVPILEVLFQISNPTEVANSFVNDSVFFIMGSLMMGVAIVNQGLDTRIALVIIKFTGNQVKYISSGFMTISAILSSFIGEHTVVAMMLPVAITLIKNISVHKSTPNLTALLLFSIAYGCTIGGIGTPSGGARNALMLSYLKSIPENGISLSYFEWILFAYPMVIIRIFFASWLLRIAFIPELKYLDTPIRKLKVKVGHKGNISNKEILAIIIFCITFLGWVFLNERIGIGIIALSGAFLYLATGIVSWNTISRNTNWGIIFLFASAISLGAQMKNHGTAVWISDSFIDMFQFLINQYDFFPYVVSTFFTMLLSNIISSSATVAVLGPIMLNMSGDPLLMGMTTAISSAFGYFSAIASPACMIIYSTGMIKMIDFLKAGWRIGLMSIIVLFLIIKLYWPFLVNYIEL